MNTVVETSNTEELVTSKQHDRFFRKPRWMSGKAAALLQNKTEKAQKPTTQRVNTHGSRPRFI